jgi:hypothetical protein
MSDSDKSKAVRALAEEITRRFTDAGKLIELGFELYRLYVIPEDAPDVQIAECRLAFMAGAEHLFSSVISILDPGSEPSERDLRRMQAISDELTAWRARLETAVRSQTKQ